MCSSSYSQKNINVKIHVRSYLATSYTCYIGCIHIYVATLCLHSYNVASYFNFIINNVPIDIFMNSYIASKHKDLHIDNNLILEC